MSVSCAKIALSQSSRRVFVQATTCARKPILVESDTPFGGTEITRDFSRSSLAAILAADPVGYSRLIGADEGGTLQARRSNPPDTVRNRLSAGGNRIRTIGPALVEGLSAVADVRCRTDKLDGVIKHRSSREPTMVGRGASLDGRLFLGGTDGSNPVPPSAESREVRIDLRGSSHQHGQPAHLCLPSRFERP